MPLFQHSVLQRHINELDANELVSAWNRFAKHFHDPVIQENIRNLKEEEYQEGFFRDLFVTVLGYTLNPQPSFNLVLEKKSITDATKSDGAIVFEDKIKAVIELKDTSTPDLGKVVGQAFGYKHKHKDCRYVITSNFEKLRFYIDDSTEEIEFDLFTLDRESFKVLYLCLHVNNLRAGLPAFIKSSSLVQEQDITDELYVQYSSFKSQLFSNIQQKNGGFDQLLLFQKTQKLLDRLLFLLFAEDRLLIPPNTIREILQQWQDLRENYDQYFPLYERFKKYFGYLNTGFKSKNQEIFAYNGGLFAPDEVLDVLIIDDEILFNGSNALSKYNFQTDVDVNILGHIFEHSLSEIEELQASLQGQVLEKKQTKRKKHGVYYTPSFITRYIVQRTVGDLCSKKKAELNLTEESFAPGKRKQQKKLLNEKLDAYRDWLIGIQICDPACGSGAFLNASLDFLINEHRIIDEWKAKLFGASIIYSDIENSILENNLFGVDINPDAIEIAKLSLWLRTAKKGRKLNDLSGHIKVGNSLIDDYSVAGESAFNWSKKFPDVFTKGGFDVIIGNPPYLRVQGLRDNFEQETQYYTKRYSSATGRFDIYVLFIEKGFELIKQSGIVSLILPHKFLVSNFGTGIRKFLASNKAIQKIISFGSEMVFKDATTYTSIIVLSHNNETLYYTTVAPLEVMNSKTFDSIALQSLSDSKWNLLNRADQQIFDKLYHQPLRAKNIFEYISQGTVSVGDDIFILDGEISNGRFRGFSERLGKIVELESAIMKPLLKGDDIKQYAPLSTTTYLIYPHYQQKDNTLPLEEKLFAELYPLSYSYLLQFKEELIAKKIKYKTNPKYWYSLHRAREIAMFEQDKIITPETSLGTNMTYDQNRFYHNTQGYSFVKFKERKEDYHFLLAVLNSPVMWFFLKNTGTVLRGGYFRFKTSYLEEFPMPHGSEQDQHTLIEKVKLLLALRAQIEQQRSAFVHFISSKWHTLRPNQIVTNWHALNFSAFLSELQKQKIVIPLSDQQEWLTLFEKHCSNINAVIFAAQTTLDEINNVVYELYGLTHEEIAIIKSTAVEENIDVDL